MSTSSIDIVQKQVTERQLPSNRSDAGGEMSKKKKVKRRHVDFSGADLVSAFFHLGLIAGSLFKT